MEKVPGGKSKIGSYAIALKLLKEHANEYDISENLIEDNFKKHLEETMTMEDLITLDLNETFGKVLNEEKLKKGTYKVVNNDGTKLKKGELVVIKKDQKPDEVVLGEPLFMVKGSKGNSGYVTPFMLKKVK
jgi:ATP sulfurylase